MPFRGVFGWCGSSAGERGGDFWGTPICGAKQGRKPAAFENQTIPFPDLSNALKAGISEAGIDDALRTVAHLAIHSFFSCSAAASRQRRSTRST